MNALTQPLSRTVRRAAGWIAAGLSGLVWSAQAADVYWSIGIHQPGVHVGVSNAPPLPPVVVYPAPQVIHVPPRVVYGPPPVVVYPQPVYRTGWMPPGHAKHWHKHGYRYDDRRDDRRYHDRDRRDDRRDHRR